MAKRYLILHHSADPSPLPQYAKIDRYHRAKGWGMVGYQYVVEHDGTVRQGRTEDMVGAHTLSTDPRYPNLNHTGIGICLAGDFTQHEPSLAQVNALEKLVGEIQARHRIPDDRILLHREVKQTSCPGVDLRALLMDRRDYLKRIEEKPTDPRVLARLVKRLTGSLKRAMERRLGRLRRT